MVGVGVTLLVDCGQHVDDLARLSVCGPCPIDEHLLVAVGVEDVLRHDDLDLVDRREQRSRPAASTIAAR